KRTKWATARPRRHNQVTSRSASVELAIRVNSSACSTSHSTRTRASASPKFRVRRSSLRIWLSNGLATIDCPPLGRRANATPPSILPPFLVRQEEASYSDPAAHWQRQ